VRDLLARFCWHGSAGALLPARFCRRVSAGAFPPARFRWSVVAGALLLECCCWSVVAGALLLARFPACVPVCVWLTFLTMACFVLACLHFTVHKMASRMFAFLAQLFQTVI